LRATAPTAAGHPCISSLHFHGSAARRKPGTPPHCMNRQQRQWPLPSTNPSGCFTHLLGRGACRRWGSSKQKWDPPSKKPSRASGLLGRGAKLLDEQVAQLGQQDLLLAGDALQHETTATVSQLTSTLTPRQSLAVERNQRHWPLLKIMRSVSVRTAAAGGVQLPSKLDCIASGRCRGRQHTQLVQRHR